MAWLIAGDIEALELLDAAAEMAAAALASRSRRIDEDGVIKRSVDMGRIKLQTLRSSIHQPPMITWPEVDAVGRGKFMAIVAAFADAANDDERQVLFEQIRAFILRPGTKEPFSGGEKPWSDGDLSAPRMAGSTAPASQNAPAVRRVRKKNRDGNPSPHSFD